MPNDVTDPGMQKCKGNKQWSLLNSFKTFTDYNNPVFDV